MGSRNGVWCGWYQKPKGYLTVYLTLTLTVLLSLYLALIESARYNAIRLESECITDIALNSVMAEYHRELLSQYNLFAIDSSYGSSEASIVKTEGRLREYLDRNLSTEDIFLSEWLYKDFLSMELQEVKMTQVSMLTDGGGAVLRKRAVEAIKDDVGIELLEELSQWAETVRSNDMLHRSIATEKEKIDEEIMEYDGMEIQISETEWYTVEIENPTDVLEDVRASGILDFVTDDGETFSNKSIEQGELISTRMEKGNVTVGNIQSAEQLQETDLLERFFFQEYLLRYMGRYGEVKSPAALDYQVEYLIAGENEDIRNLEYVINVLCALREVSNVIYIYSDDVKCAEAEVLGVVIASMLMVPEIAELLKHTILLGWSFAESLHDMEVLLQGGKVPLVKDAASWHYNLSGALDLSGREFRETKGLSYADYMRILLYFTDMDTLTKRAMNVMEADIRQTPGNQFFRLDACCDALEAVISIKSTYGYEVELTRGKKY